MEDLGLFQPPDPDYFAQHPDHLWDAGKLHMDLDDIFTTLPRQFNFMSIPILDRDAFRLEASNVASIAHDRAEFFALLQNQLEARRKEQLDMMMHALSRLAWDPAQIKEAKHWGHAMHIYRSKSFDSIVRFLAGFLRDPESQRAASSTMISAVGQDSQLTCQTAAASPGQSAVNATTGPPAEALSRSSSSVSTANESRTSSTARASTVPQTRKRSFTPATASTADDDEEEIQPAKKIRPDDNLVEPRLAQSLASPPRPRLPRAKRVRKGQPLMSESASSTRIPDATAPSTVYEANGSYPFECYNSASTSRQTLRNSRQYVESALECPDSKNEVDDIRANHNAVPVASAIETCQQKETARHTPHRKPRKGRTRAHQPSLASLRNKPTTKIQKITSRSGTKTARIATQISHSRGAEHYTRSSQRLIRRTGQRGQPFYELDSNSETRLVLV